MALAPAAWLGVGTALILLYLTVLVGRLRTHLACLAVRVAGSWLTAMAVMTLGLAFR